MKLKFNVQITLYGMEKSCAVWSDERNNIPGIGEYTGVGRNIDEAVDDFFREVPMVMETSDGQKADMSRMEYELRRPYSVVHADNVVYWKIHSGVTPCAKQD